MEEPDEIIRMTQIRKQRLNQSINTGLSAVARLKQMNESKYIITAFDRIRYYRLKRKLQIIDELMTY